MMQTKTHFLVIGKDHCMSFKGDIPSKNVTYKPLRAVMIKVTAFNVEVRKRI